MRTPIAATMKNRSTIINNNKNQSWDSEYKLLTEKPTFL